MKRFRSSTPILLSTALVFLVGCGGGGSDTSEASGDSSAATSSAVADSASADASTETATDADTDPAATDAVVVSVPDEMPTGQDVLVDGGLGLICDTLPPIEEVSAIVGEPLTTITDLSQPVIEGTGAINQKCEVTGDGASLAIFERMDTITADLIAEAWAQTPVTFDGDPDLGSARGVVNGVMIDRDGVTWYATVIRMDWVASTDNPLAYTTSGELLRAWLTAN